MSTEPTLALIVAMARNRCIGRDNDLPWRLSNDLKHFKKTTMGKPIIMGRKTWESIGRPLPGRENIVVTRNADYEAPGCTVVHSLSEALEAVQTVEEACVIGGAALYEEALAAADKLYITHVEAKVAGDTYFPEFDSDAFEMTDEYRTEADEKNEYPCTYRVWERKTNG